MGAVVNTRRISPRQKGMGETELAVLGELGGILVKVLVHGQLAYVRAIGPHRVDVPIAVAIGGEGDSGPIRGQSGPPAPRLVPQLAGVVAVQ